MVLSIENISKIYGDKTVLDNVSMTVENGDRIGIVGVNGCGKTTLLKIITGEEEPETQPEPRVPHIFVTRGTSVGYLHQDSGLDRGAAVWDEMRGVFAPLDRLKEEINRLAEEIADTRVHSDPLLLAEKSEQYARKTAAFEAKDGYMVDVKVRKVLFGMGFDEGTFQQPIAQLSGGEKTRLAIAKLLLEEPSLLILDEPTNHLDYDTMMWLEDYLAEYKGALIVVSHDRYFLDRVVTSVCEIQRGRLRRFKGNYSRYRELKQEADERQMKEYLAQQEEIAKLQEYIDRNLVRASTSDMAKSRIKKLESMERIEKPVLPDKAAMIRFEYDQEPYQDVLEVKGLKLAVGGKDLAGPTSFTIRRGERVGIVGANGTGKTTLMRMLMNQIPHEGQVIWNRNVRRSYFDQENRQLHPQMTVLEEIQDRYRGMSDGEIRKLLGLVRITGENVFKQVGVISGGERAKLCFALMMLERGNVLLLDEPTNHLDIDTREAIEDALAHYTGTMILVSHDRYLLEKTVNRVIEITPGRLTVYEENYEGYAGKKRRQLREEQERRAEEKRAEQLETARNKKAAAHLSRRDKAENQRRKARIRELERLISETEQRMDQVNRDMADPKVAADYVLMNERCSEYDALRVRQEEYTEEWLTLSEEMENEI